jgi:hypothetical protein
MSKADELGKLAALRDQGALSEQAYERLKSELLTQSSGVRRWPLVALVALLVLAAGIGAGVWLRQDETASVTPATAVVTQQPPTTTQPTTTTEAAAKPTATTSVTERKAAEDQRQMDEFNSGYVNARVRLSQETLTERLGELWAKNGASPTEVAACSRDAIYDYFNLDTSFPPNDVGVTPLYLVLVCGGYTEDEAKAVVGQ